MRVKALKQFSNSYTGSVLPGDYLTLPDHVAIQFQGFGLVELLREAPATSPLANGPAKQSSASPVAQVSPQNSVNTSGEKPESSQSTPVTKEPPLPMSSSQLTELGGNVGAKKSRSRRKSGAPTTGSNSDSKPTESE